jgi:superfamily I DNA/RNA helicase
MSDDMKVSEGLEFPVVALPGMGHMPGKGEDEQVAARVFYVAATRATQRLVIEVGGDRGGGVGCDGDDQCAIFKTETGRLKCV